MGDNSIGLPHTSAGRRAASYWFIDGLPEIICGVSFVALGAAGLSMMSARPLLWIERAAWLGLMALLLAVLFGWERKAADYIKTRLTYPRTGYVRPPISAEAARQREVVMSLGLAQQPPPDENVTGFRERTVAVLFLARIACELITRTWALPLVMSAAAFALYVLNYRGERPYHWSSLLFLPLAAVLSMDLNVAAGLQQWLVFLIGGVWLAAQGAWRLLWYIRTNPARPLAKGVHV